MGYGILDIDSIVSTLRCLNQHSLKGFNRWWKCSYPCIVSTTSNNGIEVGLFKESYGANMVEPILYF